MFAKKITVGVQTIVIESPLKALTKVQAEKLDADKGTGHAAARAWMQEYVALQYASDAIDGDLTTRAFECLKECTTFEDFEYARQQFKEFYSLEYKARFPKNTDDACKEAMYNAWSRFVKRAEKLGYVSPKKAKQTPKTTPKGQTKSGKVDGRSKGNNTGKGKTQAPKAATVTEAMSAVVAQTKSLDSDLSVALDWVRQSADNRAAFLAWFKQQKAAQLVSVPTAKAA